MNWDLTAAIIWGSLYISGVLAAIALVKNNRAIMLLASATLLPFTAMMILYPTIRYAVLFTFVTTTASGFYLGRQGVLVSRVLVIPLFVMVVFGYNLMNTPSVPNREIPPPGSMQYP